MKKNKKPMKATPVIETKEAMPIPGSVGEFISLLEQFPLDSGFNLNGNAKITNPGMFYDGEPVSVVVYPSEEAIKHDYPEACECDKDKAIFKELESCITDECECACDTIKENPVMDRHLFGYANENPELMDELRHMPTDRIIEGPVMMPNIQELQFEGRELLPHQVLCIDEIRQHNMHVAECMGELYRRQIAALLEYNTQCLAHFGIETNRVMCTIINSDNDEF